MGIGADGKRRLTSGGPVRRVLRTVLLRLTWLLSPVLWWRRIVRWLRILVFGQSHAPMSGEAMAGQTLEVFGLVLRDLGRFDEAAHMLSVVSRDYPHKVNSHRYLAEVHFAQRRTDAALAAILKGLEVTDPGRAFRLAERGGLDSPDSVLAARREAVPAPARMVIATSVMPRRLELQRLAVESWLDQGFEVVSVNTAAETATLAPHFPGVRFVEPATTAEALCGRPLVPIHELMAALAASGAEVCGIVNSDIVFRDGGALHDTVAREYRRSLVFGNRIEIEEPAKDTGQPYRGGYDFFFFERAATGIFLGNGMVLGMPWWDFWIPVASRIGGLSLKKVAAPAIYHLSHIVGYDEAFFYSFCAVFLADIDRLIDRFADDGVCQADLFLRRLYDAVHAQVGRDGAKAPRRVAGPLCAFTNFLIDDMARPLTAAKS